MRIEHIALWTTDLEQMRRFYTTYFGATATAKYKNPKTQFESYFLTFKSGARLEIMQRPDVHEGSKEEILGYAHFAMAVGSQAKVDSLTAQLITAGHACISGPRTTGDGYYESVVLDPEGNRIEITV